MIDRDVLKEFLIETYPGPQRASLGPVMVFLLDTSEAEQQAAVDAWKAEKLPRLQAVADSHAEAAACTQTLIDKLVLD
jgi:hypothetical protein